MMSAMEKFKQIKLSIIVPTYGVEKYIKRFFASLEKNLLKGIEVIIIDDGSKDRSGVLSDEFALKYCEYIRVIHKENGGVSSARNKGMELAKGEYIIFADPDDYLADCYAENILNAIESYNKPDMIFFDYFYGSENTGFKSNNVRHLKKGFIDKEVFIREQAKDIQVNGSLCLKVIRKSLYDGLWFSNKTRLSEDHEMLTELSLRCETIVYLPMSLYYYINREDSITHTITLQDQIKLYEIALARYTKHSKLYKNLSVAMLVKAAYNVIVKSYAENSDIDIVVYENTIKDNICKIIFSSEFKLNDKKRLIFVYLGILELYYKSKYNKH